MSVSEVICYLTEMGLVVTRMPNDAKTLHVMSSREVPEWVWRIRGWYVEPCGIGRVFMIAAK
jgi:hypothetical protein